MLIYIEYFFTCEKKTQINFSRQTVISVENSYQKVQLNYVIL